MIERSSQRHRLGIARAGLLALAALALTAAGPAQSPRLESVRGPVEIGSGEPMVWRAAQEGDLLAAGDLVRTGPDARAEVRLRTGSVRLYENSLLRIPASGGLDGQSERVHLEEGKSLFDVLRRSADERFEVDTPEVAVMVKGTRFSVGVDEGLTSVAVFRGLVGVRELTQTLEREVLVRPGFALVGGSEVPFELSIHTEPDPWDTWSRAIATPQAQRKLGAQPAAARHAIRAARESAVESARPILVERANRIRLERPAAEAKLAAVRAAQEAAKERAVEEAPGESPEAAEIDPVLDAPSGTVAREIREEFIEAALNGSTGASEFTVELITSGGPNAVVITSSTCGQTLTEDEVTTIVENADTSLFDPTLLTSMQTNGVDPLEFAQQLDALLR